MVGEGAGGRERWEAQGHQERDTEDAEKKGGAGRQRREKRSAERDKAPQDSEESGHVNTHSGNRDGRPGEDTSPGSPSPW